jgi:copper chaperone NosL
MKTLNPISRIAIAVSALLLLSAYRVPLWQILMWAPQYPEGLSMKIWINNITGDVKIISALNHYIGMKHIEVAMFPEFGYMSYIVGAVILAGLVAALINRRALLVIYALLLAACGLAALVDFYLWGYNYGHNLDPTAPIIVPGMSYQPPLIGTKQLLNFTAFSGPDIGGWIFFASTLIAWGALAFDIYKSRLKKIRALASPSTVLVLLLVMTSCQTNPEPIQYGKDACHHCKMTMVDQKFGAEVVTSKGKIFKFDDVNCLLSFLNEGQVKKEYIAHCVITDFSHPGAFIDVKSARYLKSVQISSPMASNIAAFEQQIDLDSYNEAWHGVELTWDQLTTPAVKK